MVHEQEVTRLEHHNLTLSYEAQTFRRSFIFKVLTDDVGNGHTRENKMAKDRRLQYGDSTQNSRKCLSVFIVGGVHR